MTKSSQAWKYPLTVMGTPSEGDSRVREACTTNATALTMIKASIVGSVYLVII